MEINKKIGVKFAINTNFVKNLTSPLEEIIIRDASGRGIYQEQP